MDVEFFNFKKWFEVNLFHAKKEGGEREGGGG